MSGDVIAQAPPWPPPNAAMDCASSRWSRAYVSRGTPATAASQACLTARTPATRRSRGRPDRAPARRGTAGMADDAAAAEIEQVERLARAGVGLRRLAAPLSGAGDGQGAVLGREHRLLQRVEGADEGIVGLP